jgi:hypothetical protein
MNRSQTGRADCIGRVLHRASWSAVSRETDRVRSEPMRYAGAASNPVSQKRCAASANSQQNDVANLKLAARASVPHSASAATFQHDNCATDYSDIRSLAGREKMGLSKSSI